MLVSSVRDPISVFALDFDSVLAGTPANDETVAPWSELARLRQAGIRIALLATHETPQLDAAAKQLDASTLVDAESASQQLKELCARLGVPPGAICYFGPSEAPLPELGLSLTSRPANEVSPAEVRATRVTSAVASVLELRSHGLPERQKARAEGIFKASLEAHAKLVAEGAETIVTMARVVARSYEIGGKTLFLGNGGSAADAQHAAAELVGRFNFNRAPLAALSLSTDTSVLTCIANDWEYDEVFARQVRALARPGDVVIGLSTSGRSENVARALRAAKEVGATALAFTGQAGRKVGEEADFLMAVPSASTPRIQELHILALHTLCDLVEDQLFGHAEHPES